MKARLLGALTLSAGSKTALVTSPGFARAFATNLVVTSALAAIATQVPTVNSHAVKVVHAFQLATLSAAHKWAWWSALSLLSSSCCALQLLLNLMSVGCAGFNRVLGPIRPLLLSITTILQLSMWRVALSQPWQIPYAAGASVLTATLTFLPELIDVLNRARSARLAAAGVATAGDGLAAADQYEVQLALPSIGCTACVSKITSVLAAHPLRSSICEVAVDVETKRARLVIGTSSSSSSSTLPAGSMAAEAGFPIGAPSPAARAPASVEGADGGDAAASVSAIVAALARALDEGGFACDGVPAIRKLPPAAPMPSARPGQPDALRLHGGSAGCAAAAGMVADAVRTPNRGSSVALGQGALRTYVIPWVGGLLASSCCALQLLANAASASLGLGLGCAGFNTLLGPWRPHLRALTAAWLGHLWLPAVRARRPPGRALLLSTALTVGLALLPELLRLTGGPAIAPPTSKVATISVAIDGMGCEACELAVRQALAPASGIVETRARFESGIAELTVAEGWGFDLGEVRERLSAAGFELRQLPSAGAGA